MTIFLRIRHIREMDIKYIKNKEEYKIRITKKGFIETHSDNLYTFKLKKKIV